MDYAGNSNKAKEEADEKEEVPVPEKSLEKLVTGEVTVKKKGFGRRFRELFFGDDFKNVCSYVYEEKVIPGIQNAMFDAIIGGTERALFGKRRSPSASTRHPAMSPRVQYNNPDRGRVDPRQSARLPHQPPHRANVNRREANDIVLTSREEAKSVLEMMDQCIDKYQVFSLADLYEVLGLPKATVDQRWGWTNVTHADIRQIRDGYLLELPPMEEI